VAVVVEEKEQHAEQRERNNRCNYVHSVIEWGAASGINVARRKDMGHGTKDTGYRV